VTTTATFLGWLLCLAAGFALQRRVRDPERLSQLFFLATFWVTEPLVVFFAYTTIRFAPQLVAALALAVLASWTIVGLAVLSTRSLGGTPGTRASLILASALGNTGVVGYPLAVLVFGPQGLALAVLYSEFAFLIPALAVSTGIARHFAGPESRMPASPGPGALVRSWVLNPPVAAAVLALALRLAGVDARPLADPIGPVTGVAIGLFGFLQIGLATPLHRVAHTAADLLRGGVALVFRFGMAPLVLFVLGRLTGVPIPGVFLLLAACPVAFHTMVLARVYHLDAPLQRLLIAVSTPALVGAVLVWHALA
jgi:predicted permease